MRPIARLAAQLMADADLAGTAIAAADLVKSAGQAVVNGVPAADLLEMADLTGVLLSKEELAAISGGDVHALSAFLQRVLYCNGGVAWEPFPSAPKLVTDDRMPRLLAGEHMRQTELAPGEPGYIIQQLDKLLEYASGYPQVVSGDGQNAGNQFWYGNQSIANQVAANRENHLRKVRDRMGAGYLRPDGVQPGLDVVGGSKCEPQMAEDAPMAPWVEELSKGPLGSKRLGRFENVPQPLRIRAAKPKVARVLTADEALHRTMLSKNHQHAQAKLTDAGKRARYQRAFKQRWVGNEPFHLTKLPLDKLDRRPFTVDEAKVASLVKNPPPDDGNYPIIGDNPSRSDHKHLILDGNHRVEAAIRRGDRHLKAYVKACCLPDFADEPVEKAIASVKAHMSHSKTGKIEQVREHTMRVNKNAVVAGIAQFQPSEKHLKAVLDAVRDHEKDEPVVVHHFADEDSAKHAAVLLGKIHGSKFKASSYTEFGRKRHYVKPVGPIGEVDYDQWLKVVKDSEKLATKHWNGKVVDGATHKFPGVLEDAIPEIQGALNVLAVNPKDGFAKLTIKSNLESIETIGDGETAVLVGREVRLTMSDGTRYTLRPTQEGVEAIKKLRQLTRDPYVDWANGLPDPQKKAVRMYLTTHGCKSINQALRSRTIPAKVATQIEHLDSVAASVNLAQDTTVYRGMASGPLHGLLKDGGAKAIGRSFKDDAFVSTSADYAIASNFAFGGMYHGTTNDRPLIVQMTLPKGTHAIPVEGLRKGTDYDESEIILPRGSSFTIKGITEKRGITHVEVVYNPPSSEKTVGKLQKAHNDASDRHQRFIWQGSDIELLDEDLEKAIAPLGVRDRLRKGRKLVTDRTTNTVLTPEAAKYLLGLEGSKGGCHADGVHEAARKLAGPRAITLAHLKAAEAGDPVPDDTLDSIAEAFGVKLARDDSGRPRASLIKGGMKRMLEEVSVRAHMGRSKTGKTFQVRQHTRKADHRALVRAIANALDRNDPGQMERHEFVDARTDRAQLAANYHDGDTRLASSREKPAEVTHHPEGTWKIDSFNGLHGHEIEQLVHLDPHHLKLGENNVENNYEGRGDDAERYAGWLSEGKQPPPIHVVQTESGELRVTDGHRRVAAAKKAGVKVPAWVSYAAPTDGKDANGKPILTGYTHELAQRGVQPIPVKLPSQAIAKGLAGMSEAQLDALTEAGLEAYGV